MTPNFYSDNDIKKIFQITPRWNSLALDYLSHRRHLPVINCISRESKHNHGMTRLNATLEKRYLDYFGMTRWAELKDYQFDVSEQQLILRIDIVIFKILNTFF